MDHSIIICTNSYKSVNDESVPTNTYTNLSMGNRNMRLQCCCYCCFVVVVFDVEGDVEGELYVVETLVSTLVVATAVSRRC